MVARNEHKVSEPFGGSATNCECIYNGQEGRLCHSDSRTTKCTESFAPCSRGPCADDDLLEAYYALRLLWERHGPANLVIDYTDVTDFLISTEAVRDHSYRLPTVDTDYLLIAVAPKHIMYEIARMFELMTVETRPNMHVVHSMKEALALMDVSSAIFIPVQSPEAA